VPPYVAVVGSGELATPHADVAEWVGRSLADRGAIVVTGGLGGVMEAASRGAREAGGTTVGILPGSDRSAANPYVDIAIPTGLGEARNALIARAADALIAIGGSWGTLSEIALALRAGKRVVGLRSWEVRNPDLPSERILAASGPQEAVELALEGLGG
jgi:uncharacterized protein (TIGR00725 family)